MDPKVKTKLSEQCNPDETYEQFIRSSEKEFGLEPAYLEVFELEDLAKYIGMLDYLWEK